MTNLAQRTLSGAVFVSLVITSIFTSPYLFGAFFLLITALSSYEFYKLVNTQKEVSVSLWSGVLASMVLFATYFVWVKEGSDWGVFVFYIFFVIGVIVVELFRKQTNAIQNWANFLLGQIFIALPFALLNKILFIPGEVEAFNQVSWFAPQTGTVLLFALFITIWVNDSWAYVFGVSFGKHKLFPRVSPKKSWEGLIGGALMSLLTGFGFSFLIPDLTLVQWLIFAEIVVLFGTFGDLVESMLKRTLAIKDSGYVIPGHGGLLDRFDSMLLAAPAIYFFLLLIEVL